MCRELTPRSLVVNSLYAAVNPIPIEPDFWQYISIVSKILEERISDIEIRNDHYSIESVLWYQDPFILKQENTIHLNEKFRDESYFANIVNDGLDEDIKNILPSIIKEAYQIYAKHR